MKKFLYKLFLYVSILFIGALLVQLAISFKIRNETVTGHDNFHIIKNQKNDLVFLGSSRCYQHFDPKIFLDSLNIKSVNLGVEGHNDLTMHIMRLKYYLAYNPAPKIVILSFDPMVSAGPFDLDSNWDFTQKPFFSRYAFFPLKDDIMIARYFHFNFLEKYIPLYALLKYRLFFYCIHSNANKVWLSKGFSEQGMNKNWDTTYNSEARKYFLKIYPYFNRDYDSVKIHLAYLNNLCKEYKIKLVCVQTPVYKTLYDPVVFSQTKKMCKELNLLFIDTNEEPIIDNVDNFVNADHLSAEGVPVTMNIIIKNKDFLETVNGK